MTGSESVVQQCRIGSERELPFLRFRWRSAAALTFLSIYLLAIGVVRLRDGRLAQSLSRDLPPSAMGVRGNDQVT